VSRKVLILLNVTRILTVAILAAGAFGVSLMAHGRQDSKTQQGQTSAAPKQGDSGRSQGSRSGPRFGDVMPWWKDPEIVKELALTPMQVAKINGIYERRQRAIKTTADEFERLRTDLDRMIKERKVKPSEIEAQARKLTYPHLEIDISRIKMLYEMSLELKPEQQEKFDKLESARRGRGPGPGRNSGPR
jgi:Spy/CpxP family protein refolding chaperone